MKYSINIYLPKMQEDNNIEKIRDFFAKNGSPKWETLRTCSRCEGFTLSYGAFYNIKENLIREHTLKKLSENGNDNPSEDEIMDYRYESIIEIIDEWRVKYPELNFYLLPCCWPGETNFDFFVGFNVYPLLWTKRRYFIENYKLLSALDDWFMSEEQKNKILNKYKHLEKYKAPDFLEVEYIFDLYCSMDSWKNCLYLKNYPKLTGWIPMLNDLYKDEIATRTIVHQKFLIDELIHKPKMEWVFLPSDCSSCS